MLVINNKFALTLSRSFYNNFYNQFIKFINVNSIYKIDLIDEEVNYQFIDSTYF